ncbi:hypothetical protein [Duganella fentianensis]|uniref:hypothetical protein n=1 Tax=Duganella fentianensis TaxID=2692177 RepID=UPI0032B1568F
MKEAQKFSSGNPVKPLRPAVTISTEKLLVTKLADPAGFVYEYSEKIALKASVCRAAVG